MLEWLWFIVGIEFWWRAADFEVRRRAQMRRRLMVPWHCVDVFVIHFSSRTEVILHTSMVGIDDRDVSGWLFVPNPSVLAYFCGVVFSRGTAAFLVVCIAQVDLAVMTALQFLYCTFHGVKKLCLATASRDAR